MRPFRLHEPQHELDELRRRITATRWPDELPAAEWDYGVRRDHLRELAEYWGSDYNWRRCEKELNAVGQFRTGIDGTGVHGLHARSSDPDAIPLLLTHGWPSTPGDFRSVVGPLTEPRRGGSPDAPSFHVVAPSLPGFGYSGPTAERGWDVNRIARAWTTLMATLGYEQYLVQGGDYGSLVSAQVARDAPDRVLGLHLNALITTADPDDPAIDSRMSAADRETVRREEAEWALRQGYAVQQSTRPQTVAYALTDSPVGLLAWMLEWFVDYDPTRSPQTTIARDAILDNVTTFWLTRTAGSAARLYKESRNSFEAQPPPEVPTAIAVFPGDHTVRPVAEHEFRVLRWNTFDRGGHFAALQAPDLLVDDLRGFVDDHVPS